MPDPERAQARVNDFTVKFANVNGTGSASANALIMKSIFRMGVPVVGKNFFPSNIQGLPTWYEIRVTAEGWRARSGRVDIMVAMNPETYGRDLRDLATGGWLVYDSTWPRPALLSRPDVTLIGVPQREASYTFGQFVAGYIIGKLGGQARVETTLDYPPLMTSAEATALRASRDNSPNFMV